MVTPAGPSLISAVRDIPDFPKKGIVFRDITTLLKDPETFSRALDAMADHYRNANIAKIVAIEARGFILGAALADRLGAGFVPVRKKGKLPSETIQESYSLEYGTDAVEMHTDALRPGDRVVLHDDLLATGGTMQAAVRLTEKLGGVIVGISVLIELSFLRGREKLRPHDVFSVIAYDAE